LLPLLRILLPPLLLLLLLLPLQLLDLIKGANEAGQAGINVMDEFQVSKP
jgi:hypothetical protein